MPSEKLRLKDEHTSITGTEWLYLQLAATPYTVLKIALNTIKNWVMGASTLFIGKSFQFLATYEAISESFPWFNMSLPDQDWTTSHYSSDFIDEMRSRKVIYDELSTAVSSFTGTWSSGVFTLDNTTANNAMLAELAEEYLYAGSPTTNWRLLNDGTNDFNVTAISTSARTITVSTTDHTPSGTSISIYLHRVYGSTTSARHFSWAGLGLYMCGGGKISGLRRRDAMQQITGNIGAYSAVAYTYSGAFTTASVSTWAEGGSTAHQTRTLSFNSANSPDARTASKTRIESGTLNIYLYVGSYTA